MDSRKLRSGFLCLLLSLAAPAGFANPTEPTVGQGSSIGAAQGRLLFLRSSMRTESVLNLDIVHVVLKIPPSVRDGGDYSARGGELLSNGRIFVIGADRGRFSRSAAGSLRLVPGASAEFADLGIPFVRVYLVAPSRAPLDVEALVSRRPQLGIFNALFVPAAPQRADPGKGNSRVLTASVEERPVHSLPIPPAPVEERLLAAFAAPVEERLIFAFAAPVEERAIMAFAAPVEERPVLALPIPAALVEERLFAAFAAPVEERAIMAFAAPVEERPVLALPIPAAPVEERLFAAFAAPVEERAIMAFAAPVEERPMQSLPIPPAPVEERIKAALAAAPAPVAVASAPQSAAHTVQTGAKQAVKLAAIHRRMPQIMIDRKGALFFM